MNNQEEFVMLLHTGGSWVQKGGEYVVKYEGIKIAKRVLKLPSTFTYLELMNRLRRELGLHAEEAVRLRYPFLTNPVGDLSVYLPVDIRSDRGLDHFMKHSFRNAKKSEKAYEFYIG